MSSRACRVLVWMVVAVCLGLVAAAPASAQIYAIRDENGVLTLSDKPLGEGAQTYAVARRAPAPRDRRAGSGEGVRSSQWDDVIDHHAREQGLRPDLVRAVIQVESAFNPRARSNKGAMGLMQLMPATARDLGVRNAYDPLENIRGGVAYLRGAARPVQRQRGARAGRLQRRRRQGDQVPAAPSRPTARPATTSAASRARPAPTSVSAA